MSSYVETSMEIAREAGALVAEYFEQRIGYQMKGEFDLVTEADKASEKLIVERLIKHFPSHSIVAEEGGGHESPSEYRWYVDPLDGTTNFAHGFPMFNVTLGLERAGEMIAGCVFDPVHNEMFSAERGSGAWLNGKPIHVSSVSRLDDSLVATGFPSRKRHRDINVHFFYQLAMFTHGVRRPGAAALDLAYVASGRTEAFWEFKLNPWDMAAGILLVTEAGGKVSDMHGQPVSLKGPHILADNGGVHAEILALFAEVFEDKVRVPLPEMNPPA